MTNTNRAKEKTPAVQAGQSHAAPGVVGDSLGMGEENHLRRLRGLGEFRPNFVPVGRAQVLAGDGAISRLLNGDAVLRAGLSVGVPVLPLANLSFAAHANTRG